MIGERLKHIRKQKGLSQKELAALINSSQGYVCDIEKGKKLPGSDFLISLKRFLGVDLDWFLVGEGEIRWGQPITNIEPTTPYNGRNLIAISDISPTDRRAKKLCAIVERVVKEGNNKKIKALEAQLDLLDPGVKNEKAVNEQNS